MKKLRYKGLVLFLILSFFFLFSSAVSASPITSELIKEPIICGCPVKLTPIYQARGERCTTDIKEWQKDPATYHLWIEDPEITAQGKADERARQFIYWVIHNPSIDNYPVFYNIWKGSENITLFFIVLIAAISGLLIILNKKTEFSSKVEVWPRISKLFLVLLYAVFSASIVILLIQLSEVLMRFFIDKYGGNDLFNIYFAGSHSTEANYTNFVGCRDVNLRVQESVKAELFLLKLTNITYYVMGVMLLLRKILLWFMLFISPFIAILLPFVLIRNIAMIWIGVFFQWLFYGPLFAAFLGATATIWKAGLPFIFNFSRAGTKKGYIFPTATNILLGGPAQQLTALNNINYIDTFAEYIITLIMLWATIFFPWWLLRIFRDNCCDDIAAIKNLLLSSMGKFHPQPPSSFPPPTFPSMISNIRNKISSTTKKYVEQKTLSVEEIKKTKTEDIVRSLNLHVSNLRDVARLETDKKLQQEYKQHLELIKNPIKAQTPTEKEKYMLIKNELYSRSTKQDTVAQRLLATVSSSKSDVLKEKEKFVEKTPEQKPITHVISYTLKLPAQKVESITDNFFSNITQNESILNKVAEQSQADKEEVKKIVQTIPAIKSVPVTDTLQEISKKTNISQDKVAKVVKTTYSLLSSSTDKLKSNKDQVIEKVAQAQGLDKHTVEKVINTQLDILKEPKENIDKAIELPSNISLEEYEDVKKMWMNQYEKGDVPVSENINSRLEWVKNDTVFIANVLNKLLSNDKKLKQEALDEIGYIIPVFMINNLSPQELLVYLKAKLEAAKSVRELLEKEEEVKTKLKEKSEKEEEFVDIKAKSAQAPLQEKEEKLKMQLPEEKEPPSN